MPFKRADGKKQEKIFAKKHGMRNQPASGALKPPSLKGDCTTDHLLIDLKTTNKKQFTVTNAMMQKIEREALGANKVPVLAIHFTQTKQEYAVMRMDDFLEYEREYNGA